MELFLIRHGQSANNALGDVKGRDKDPELTELGEKQAECLAASPAVSLVQDYLDSAGHGDDPDAPLFRPVKNNSSGTLDKHLEGSSVYRHIVVRYGKQAGIDFAGFCPHALRATAATNALYGTEIAT